MNGEQKTIMKGRTQKHPRGWTFSRCLEHLYIHFLYILNLLKLVLQSVHDIPMQQVHTRSGGENSWKIIQEDP